MFNHPLSVPIFSVKVTIVRLQQQRKTVHYKVQCSLYANASPHSALNARAWWLCIRVYGSSLANQPYFSSARKNTCLRKSKQYLMAHAHTHTHVSFLEFHVRGMRERSPPLSKIVHPSHPVWAIAGFNKAKCNAESPPGGTACLITVSPVPGKLTFALRR